MDGAQASLPLYKAPHPRGLFCVKLELPGTGKAMTKPADAAATTKVRLQALDVSWWLLLGVTAANLVLLLIVAPGGGWHVAWRTQGLVAAASALLGLVWWIYGSIRLAPRIAGMARTGLLFILYMDAIGMFSYLVAGTLQLPLLDRQLAQIDRMLGFDWMAYHQWLRSAPWLSRATNFCYGCVGPQLLLLVLLLDLCGRGARAREFFLSFAVSSLAVSILGGLLPAAGAFVEYAVPEAHTTPYVLAYLGLRDGSMRVIDLLSMQGVVQFPSFHAAMAALCCYAVRDMRWLLPPSLLVNALVIAVTPVAGGHHFIDVIAGLLLAAAITRLLPRLARRSAA